MNLKESILNASKADRIEIEKALKENLTPYLELVSNIAGHILFSGGKRLRPLLVILCARICGNNDAFVKTLSITVEYLHAATLLHDDLVDGANLRRGVSAAHTRFGNAEAVLTGDFLLARCMTIAVKAKNLKILEHMAAITEKIAQGEVHQLIRKGDIHLGEDEYLEVIRNKTAVLMQGACRIGAIIGDASPGVENALADYGHHMGIAFQMADDLLDYTANTHTLGKSIGTDLKEGKLTLPVIHALRSASPPIRKRLIEIIKNPDFNLEEFNWFKTTLDDLGGLAYTQEKAASHVNQAKNALSIFDNCETKTLLTMIADYAQVRNQ